MTLADILWVKAVTWVSPGKHEVVSSKGVDTESSEQTGKSGTTVHGYGDNLETSSFNDFPD